MPAPIPNKLGFVSMDGRKTTATALVVTYGGRAEEAVAATLEKVVLTGAQGRVQRWRQIMEFV